MTKIDDVMQVLRSRITVDPKRVSVFFKTKPNEYSHHDMFLGVTVPEIRKVGKIFHDLSILEVGVLLSSKYNEERLLALIILCNQYLKHKLYNQDEIYNFYVSNLHNVNNWNLVDSSAHLILGAHVFYKKAEVSVLENLAKMQSLWNRRSAIVATWYFIRKNYVDLTFIISEILLQDKEDLIHKAVGWMLREAGKKNKEKLVTFLKIYAPTMPRTMLRYAVEKFPEDERKLWIKVSKAKI